MRSVATILGLVLALGVGYFLYQASMTPGSVSQAPPQQQIDVTGVRSDLLSIGQGERQYLIAHGTYGTLDELRREGLTNVDAQQRGYAYSVTVEGTRGFTVTATAADPGKAGWPTLAISETMQITQP